MAVEIDKRNKKVVLSLGGNLGDVKQTFIDAIEMLKNRIGDQVSVSSIYQTKAWGVESQPDFLNQIIVFSTKLSPEDLLEVCLTVEKLLGRVRLGRQKWHERTLDIDVLFYEKKIIDTPSLTIPHPHLHERNFVLFPLVEIIPAFVHPIFNKTMVELKKKCEDKLQVISFLD
jgi:2-amino-4-hydroxy-6-hydroxymethyldihydropteridine diphosphokinase